MGEGNQLHDDPPHCNVASRPMRHPLRPVWQLASTSGGNWHSPIVKCHGIHGVERTKGEAKHKPADFRRDPRLRRLHIITHESKGDKCAPSLWPGLIGWQSNLSLQRMDIMPVALFSFGSPGSLDGLLSSSGLSSSRLSSCGHGWGLLPSGSRSFLRPSLPSRVSIVRGHYGMVCLPPHCPSSVAAASSLSPA